MIASHVSLFEDILLKIKQLPSTNTDVHVCLASTVEQGEETLAFRRLNLSDKLATTFCVKIQEFFEGSGKVEGYREIWEDGGRIVQPYSGDSRPQKHEVEYLRTNGESYKFIQQQIALLQAYQDFLSFQANDKEFKNLRFYVVIIKPLSNPQETMYFYRFYTRRQLFKQSFPILAVFRDTNEYDLVEEPTLLFDDTVDCISRGDDLFILKKENFHSIFRFLEELEKKTDDAIATIQGQLAHIHVSIVGDTDFFRDSRNNKLKKAMLTTIANKPYLKDLTYEKIERVVNRLKDKNIVDQSFSDTFKTAKTLTYDAKRPWILLKLLNDSYLWSEMTSLGYDVSDKREL